MKLDEIGDFVMKQLFVWPLAKQNHEALASVVCKNMCVADMKITVQHNPARVISTNAKTDPLSIAGRKCFLCRINRPEEQFSINILEGWELLVNPYPILPLHLTIAAKQHIPQSQVPHDILELAGKLRGMVVFFNGAKAGASAPDHLHLQAVPKDYLPLIHIVEELHKPSVSNIVISRCFSFRFPYSFLSGIVADEMATEIIECGLTTGGGKCFEYMNDPELVNKFFWFDEKNKVMRFISIPRRTHRPKCFYKEGNGNFMVSPGAIDMAGVIVVPRLDDFNRIKSKDVMRIYSDVAFL